MPELQGMPEIRIDREALASWGATWLGTEGSPSTDGEPQTKRPSRFDRAQGIEFARIFDSAFANALAAMLGGVPVVTPNANALTPHQPDCVEVGTTRVVGGIRPQNYDVAYRPDGPRVVFDSKTLNEKSSIRKELAEHDQRLRVGSSDRPHAVSLLHCRFHRRHTSTSGNGAPATRNHQHT